MKKSKLSKDVIRLLKWWQMGRSARLMDNVRYIRLALRYLNPLMDKGKLL
jgi:hypothetical protein